MLARRIVLGLIGAISIGWFVDRSSLTGQLEAKIENRSLTKRSMLQDFDRFSVGLGLLGEDLGEPSLLQELPECQVVYMIMKSWQLWKETTDRRYLAFAATALGVLDCSSAQEFRDQHLVISKQVRLGFETQESASLDRFIELALTHGN